MEVARVINAEERVFLLSTFPMAEMRNAPIAPEVNALDVMAPGNPN
jgi:hypothetical protein